MAKLTPKQERFVAEYLIDLNAKRAATAAGYSAKTAEQQGYQLLHHPSVAAAIAAKREKLAEKLELSAERVLTELMLMGFANMLDYITPQADGTAIVDLSKLTRDQAAAISEVRVDVTASGDDDARETVKKVTFKLADKRGSLELLGKHLGLFPNKVDVTVTDAISTILENARRRASETQVRH